MFWGLSEALDLYHEYLSAQKTKHGEDAPKSDEATGNPTEENTQAQVAAEQADGLTSNLNILLYGAGDPRHVIKTIAKLYTHRSKNGERAMPTLNFYMVDGCIEIVARNLALLGVALENPETLMLRSKVHLFMDIYGNSLLRPSSHQYLVGKAKTLLKMVTDQDFQQSLAPALCIEGLKYRERDGLENTINFWLPKAGHIFNVQEYWVARLRHLLGTRYDYRDGAFDWDLSMVLKDREAQQLCSQEYRFWRETGIAFTYPEYEQCKPNKTLACGLVRNGDKYNHRGYVGDIQTGPFGGFGLKTEDERMTKSAHGSNDYRATDVTERNLLELFHELETGTPYEHNPDVSRKYGSVQLLMGKRITLNECDVDAMKDYDKPWLNLDGVKVNFLSIDELLALQQPNSQWRDFFDVVFVGNNYFAFVKDDFTQVLRQQGLLILETKLLTVGRKEAVAEFESKLMTFAKDNQLKGVINYNALNTKNLMLKFKKTEIKE